MTIYTIPFTQFLYPNGRSQYVEYETQNWAVQHKAHEIAEAGFRFECEVLETTGQYHGTITSDLMDHASVLCENGPGLVEQTDKMILDFDIETELARMRQETV